MFSSEASSRQLVPRRGKAGGIVPCGVTVFFTDNVPSERIVHSASCTKPALFEPVTSTATTTFTAFSPSSRATRSGRA